MMERLRSSPLTCGENYKACLFYLNDILLLLLLLRRLDSSKFSVKPDPV